MIDLCFDLAAHFNQHPDDFLDKDFDDLAFYAENASRSIKRMSRRG